MALDINDIALAQLGRLWANSGQPFEILAARRKEEQDAARALNSRLMLQEQEGRIRAGTEENILRLRTQAEKELAGDRQRFESTEKEKERTAASAEKEKDRANRLKEIDAQAEAYVNRLSRKAKEDTLESLRADGIDPKGKTIDEQLADGLSRRARGDYPKVKGAMLHMKDLQSKIEKVQKEFLDAQSEDDAAVEKYAISQARATVDNKINLGEVKKGTPEAANALSEAYQQAKLGAGSIRRPTADRARAIGVQLQNLMRDQEKFEASDAGRLALNAMAIQRASEPSAPPIDFSGVGFKPAVGDLRLAESGVDSGFRPAVGNLRSSDADRNLPIAATEAGGLSPMMGDFLSTSPGQPTAAATAPTGSGTFLGIPTRREDSKDLTPLIREALDRDSLLGIPLSRRDSRDIGPDLGRAAGAAGRFISNLPENTRIGLDAAFAPIRNAGNAVGNFVNPASDPVTQLWGPDARELLAEAEKLGESNGITADQRKATFDAALAGDRAAQEQIATVLNYIRSTKQQSLSPSLPMGSYPGVTPAYPGPSYTPAR